MNIAQTFNDFTQYLNTTYDKNTLNILIGFLGVTLFVVILRIIVVSGYQTQYLIFLHRSKRHLDKAEEMATEETAEVEGEEEKKKKKKKTKKDSKFGLIGKVMNDYRLSVEAGLNVIPTEAIIKKYLYRLNFIGWSYEGMDRFVVGFEQGIVFIGILLAVVSEGANNRMLFTVTTIAAFLVVRILASIFDYALVRDKLAVELKEYVEKEFANIHTVDLNASISKLRTDVYTAVIKQSDTLKESIDRLSSNLTGALALSVSEMTKSVEGSVERAAHFSDGLEKPFESWAENIQNASLAQEKINLALDGLGNMVYSLEQVSNTLGGNFESYVNKMQEQSDHVGGYLQTLIQLIEELRQSNDNHRLDFGAVKKELDYIDNNQKVLEESLQKYELSLEGITANMGEALGSMVGTQMQNSYNSLNDSLQNNIIQIINSNNEVVARLQVLFDDMQEQTKNQTQTIIRVKEQMDMQFDFIREKI